MLKGHPPTITINVRTVCPHCGGCGFIVQRLDIGELLAAVYTAFGTLMPFTTAELVRHASLTEGPLRVMLAGQSSRQIGKALKAAEGKTFDGLTLVRLGNDRNVALWQVAFVGLSTPTQPISLLP